MFVIELVYKADLREIDAHMGAHVRFLNKYCAAGNFLVSGRKIPREGGVILAVGETKETIEAIIREDPFHEHGLADSHHRVPDQPARGRHLDPDRR